MTAGGFPSGDSLSADEISKLGRHGYVWGTKLAGSWAPFLHDIVFRRLALPRGQVRMEGDGVEEFQTFPSPRLVRLVIFLNNIDSIC